MSQETQQDIKQPNMLSAHYQGRLLSLISRLVRPKNILEVGTYTGYSAICLAEGLAKDGKLYTIDNDAQLINIQNKYFKKSGYREHIIQLLGEGINLIPQIKAYFDLVFIDADKENYPKYFDLVINKMNSGGCILSDNVLWKGEVYSSDKKSSQAKKMIHYNKKLKSDSRIYHLILPIRDGLSLSFVK